MSTPEEEALRSRLSTARFALVALVGALEKVRDFIVGGYFAEAKAHAENTLLDAEEYLKLIDEPSNGAGGAPA